MAKTVGIRCIFKLDSLSFATARGEIYEGDWRRSRKVSPFKEGRRQNTFQLSGVKAAALEFGTGSALTSSLHWLEALSSD